MDGVEQTLVNLSLDWGTLTNTPPKLIPLSPAVTQSASQPPRHALRDQIGTAKGRITLQEHLARVDYVVNKIPQKIWPSTAYLANKFMGQTAIIVGGGPSLEHTFNELRGQCTDRTKVKVFAPNKSHDWLINGERSRRKKWNRKPLIPDFGVLCDPSDFVVTYQTPHPRVAYLLASMLDKKVLAKFLNAGAKAFIWVPVYEYDMADIETIKAKNYPVPIHFVSGGSTVGQRTINIALAMGFSRCDLYGFDSCYAPKTEKKLYAYEKPIIVHQIVDTVLRNQNTGAFFRFRTNSMMAKQAMEFYDMLERLPYLKADGERRQMDIYVHGDGLIPWMAWGASGVNTLIHHANEPYMIKKYGSPAVSWDYVEDRPMTGDEISTWQSRKAA